jgi:hypothetical protein
LRKRFWSQTRPEALTILKYNLKLIFAEPRREYILTTRWSVSGRLEQVAATFKDVQAFPRWWRPVFLKAVIVDPGAEDGKGRVAALTTRGFLPYVLRWRIRIIDAHEPFGFDFCSSGDLVGFGQWTFRQAGVHVHIELHWTVVIQKAVLNQMSLVLKPLLIRNHKWAMECGERGLQKEIQRRSTN